MVRRSQVGDAETVGHVDELGITCERRKKEIKDNSSHLSQAVGKEKMG